MAQLRTHTLNEALWLIREVSQDISPVGCFELTLPGFLASVAVLTGDLSWGPVLGGASQTVAPLRPTLAGLLYALETTQGAPKTVVSLDYDPKAPLTSLLPRIGVSMETAAPGKLLRTYYFTDAQIQEQMLAYLQAKLGNRLGSTYSDTVEYWVTHNMHHDHVQQMVLWCAYWLLDSRRQTMSGAKFMRDKAQGAEGDERLVNRSQNITTRVGDTFTLVESEQPDGAAAGNNTNLWGDQYTYLAKLQLHIRNRLEKLYQDFTLRDNVVISSGFILERNWHPNDYVDGRNLSGQATDILLGG